jgi:hypothetical protein
VEVVVLGRGPGSFGIIDLLGLGLGLGLAGAGADGSGRPRTRRFTSVRRRTNSGSSLVVIWSRAAGRLTVSSAQDGDGALLPDAQHQVFQIFPGLGVY